MAIFPDPPLPAHAPTPTDVPGPVRLVFRMHASQEGALVEVAYRILAPGVRFLDAGAPPTDVLRRTHTVGRRARAIVLDVNLAWDGMDPTSLDVPIDGDVVEPATGDALAPSWLLRVRPASATGEEAHAMFVAVTGAQPGGNHVLDAG